MQVTQQTQGFAVVLFQLVCNVADAGVGHGHLGQNLVAGGFHDRPPGGGHEFVDTRLVVAIGHGLRLSCALHECGDPGDGGGICAAGLGALL